jgi:prophage DNA circulation protein
MSRWEDFIQEGSFKGVRFDFVSAREQHANILDVKRYPARDGAVVEKRAREPLRISIMAVFIEEDYPSQLWALSEKLDDGTPGELVHPIHGTIQAACESHEVSHDAEEADSGTISITFIEHTASTGLVFQDRPSVASVASETRTASAEVITNADALLAETLDQLLETVSNAVALASAVYAEVYNLVQACIAVANLVSTTADQLEADGDTMSALEIQADANQALSDVDEQIKAVADYETTAAHDLGRSLLNAAGRLGDLAEIYISQKPPLTLVTVEADISLLAWVHARYQDSSRVNEILALNSIPDPLLIPAGTQLRAYAV